ncbi:hypothetical protein AB0L20_24685, partial [Streptomyces albidoflavus]
MSHGVLALGGAALCLSGSVWYVPAWADLRAGPDRPASRRLAATAVLLLCPPMVAPFIQGGDPGAHHLALGALAGVEQDALAVPAQQVAV